MVFGGDTRLLMQFRDDALQVFYVLEIVNNARNAGRHRRTDHHRSAARSRWRGHARGLVAIGNREWQPPDRGRPVRARDDAGAGRLSASATTVPTLRFEQEWPVAMQQVTAGVQKVGSLAISSPQFQQTRNLSTDDGVVFLIGSGAGLPAGGKLTIDLTNLPIHSRTPRYVALALAGRSLRLGVWLSVSARRQRAPDDQTPLRLAGTRSCASWRTWKSDDAPDRSATERYTTHRQRLMTELEQIYGELDDAGQGPQGGGEGIAA